MTTLNAAQTKDLATNALTALNLAQDALEKAKAMLSGAGVDLTSVNLANAVNAANAPVNASPAAKRSTTSSGGRTASPEQLAIREQINQWATSDDAGLFTVNTMTKFLGKDKIQVRNAINALTDVTLVRWAEKFQTSPGAREIVYKPVAFDVGI
jgi:hypothetical protein